MKLTDIASPEKWKALEETIYNKYGLNASVFDAEGTRLTDYVNWVNRICPVIKANENGKTFICSLAHQSIAGEAEQTRMPVADECDAGLLKVAVPIFVDDEFIGVAGGCGLLQAEGEVNTFLVQKTIGGDEEKLMELSQGIGVIPAEQIEELMDFISQQIETIIQETSLIK